jgi:hypothetical protein
MKNETYNGWTNYATWRVNLEVFDGLCPDEGESFTAMGCKEYAEQVVLDDAGEGLAKDYAQAFMADVNWYEIADSLNDSVA